MSGLETLSDEELANLYHEAEFISNWIKAVKDYVVAAMLEGRTLPGLKLVEGRRGARRWQDEEALKAFIDKMPEREMLYETKILSPTAAEKILGKDIYRDMVASFVEQPPGKPTVVAEDDPRPALMELAAEFENLND